MIGIRSSRGREDSLTITVFEGKRFCMFQVLLEKWQRKDLFSCEPILWVLCEGALQELELLFGEFGVEILLPVNITFFIQSSKLGHVTQSVLENSSFQESKLVINYTMW